MDEANIIAVGAHLEDRQRRGEHTSDHQHGEGPPTAAPHDPEPPGHRGLVPRRSTSRRAPTVANQGGVVARKGRATSPLAVSIPSVASANPVGD